jgi:hypothetical protein
MPDLTKKEAYLAMFSFLEKQYALTKADDIGALLGGMSLLQDGGTADPAMWEDWEKAITKVKAGQSDASLKLKK